MRIALVHPRLDRRGGAENVVCWQARGLAERGYEVVVATTRFAPELWRRDDWTGIALEVLREGSFDGIRGRAARKRAIGHRLRRTLGRCDAIVAHNSPAPLWATVASERMPETRVVWFCEEPRAQYHWRQSSPNLVAAAQDSAAHPGLREAFAPLIEDDRRRANRRGHRIDKQLDLDSVARVNLILANSAFTAKNVERVYGCTAVPCLLGQPRPEPAVVRPTAPYVAWVTSNNPAKNAGLFLEAIQIAARERGLRDLRVEAVGLADEPWGRRLAELGVDGIVRRHGRLDESLLNELVAGGRLLAYPAIDEPFGLVCLHAMSHGRPVLAANVGGPSETVVDGETGLHMNPLDPRDMAEKLCQLWESPERCDALGAAGRERYESNFTFDHFLDRFEALALRGREPSD
jgi:glycosyltransferase involved in cell wall biosynthesis